MASPFVKPTARIVASGYAIPLLVGRRDVYETARCWVKGWCRRGVVHASWGSGLVQPSPGCPARLKL